jgi:general secretion pathway protein A
MSPNTVLHHVDECYQALGFSRSPFGITPDTSMFFPNSQHITVYNNLRFAMTGGGIAVLTGEVGLGKTLICRYLLRNAPSNMRAALIVNPLLSYPAILATIFRDVTGRHAARGLALSEIYEGLVSFAIQRAKNGDQIVVLVDEAHKLSTESLEGLRQLTNIESERRKLFSLVLVGQPELDKILALRAMRPLRDRIAAWCRLSPLTRQQCTSYIQHRISKTQQVGSVRFSWWALLYVYIYSRGVPRRINLLCDRSLLHAYAIGRTAITSSIVRHAASDLTGTNTTSIVEEALHKLGADFEQDAQDQAGQPGSSSSPSSGYILNRPGSVGQKRTSRASTIAVLAMLLLSLAPLALIDDDTRVSARRHVQEKFLWMAAPLNALFGPIAAQQAKIAGTNTGQGQSTFAAVPAEPARASAAPATIASKETVPVQAPAKIAALVPATKELVLVDAKRAAEKPQAADEVAKPSVPAVPKAAVKTVQERQALAVVSAPTQAASKAALKADARGAIKPAPPPAVNLASAAPVSATAAAAASVPAPPPRSTPAQEPAESPRTAQGSVVSSAAAILRRFADVESLTSQGKFDAALAAVIAVEAEVGETWQTRYLKGLADKGLRRWDDSIAAFNRAHQINPGSVKVLMGRAIAQQELGNHEAALLDLQLSRVLVPNLPDIAFNTGYSLEALGRKEEALREYNRFLEMTSKRQEYERMRNWVAKRVAQ